MADLSLSQTARKAPVTEQDALVLAIMKGATKGLLHFNETLGRLSSFRNATTFVEALSQIVDTMPAHTLACLHPLSRCILSAEPALLEQLIITSSNCPAVDATGLWSAIWERVVTLEGPQERVIHARTFVEATLRKLELMRRYVPSFSLPIDAFLCADKILTASSDPAYDLTYLARVCEQRSPDATACTRVGEFYALGHKYLVGLPEILFSSGGDRRTRGETFARAVARCEPLVSPEEREWLEKASHRYSKHLTSSLISIVEKLRESRNSLGPVLAFLRSAKDINARSLAPWAAAIANLPPSEIPPILGAVTELFWNNRDFEHFLDALRAGDIERFIGMFSPGQTSLGHRPERSLHDLYAAFKRGEVGSARPPLQQDIERVLVQYTAILNQAPELAVASTQSLRQRAASFRPTTHATPPSLEEWVGFFGCVREIFRRAMGTYPFHAQLISAMLHTLPNQGSSQGRFSQVAPGEGKSASIALLASFFAWCGRHVDIVTTNTVLARRDADIYARFYLMLGIDTSLIRYRTAEEIGFAELERLVSGSDGNEQSLKPSKFDVAIADEADGTLLDSARFGLKIASAIEATVSYQSWTTLVSIVDTHEELSIQQLANIAKNEHQELRHISHNRLHLYLSSARYSKTLQPERDFLIIDGKIVPVNWSTTGRVHQGVWLGSGVHECLCIRHQVPIPRIGITRAQLSFSTLFKQYKTLHLQSATFGNEEWREIESTYNLTGFSVPRRLPLKRKSRGIVSFRDESEWLENISKRCMNMTKLTQPRPTLVVVGTMDQAFTIHRALSQLGYQPQLLTDHRNLLPNGEAATEEQVIANAGRPGVITIATSVAGRGTDIKISADAVAAGGLHVIVGFLALSVRVEQQALGRAARQGDPGSVEVLFCPSSDPFFQLLAPIVRERVEEILFSNDRQQSHFEQAIRLVRSLNTLSEIAQRDLVRARADIHFSVLKNYLAAKATHASKEGRLIPEVHKSLERKWVRISEELEADLFYPTDDGETFPEEVIQQILACRDEIFRRQEHLFLNPTSRFHECINDIVAAFTLEIAGVRASLTSGQAGSWRVAEARAKHAIDSLFS